MRIADRLALTTALVVLSAPLGAAELVNQIVLRVNGEIATLSEYQERRDARIEQVSQASNLSLEQRREFVRAAGRRAMRELFEELLVLSRAQQLRMSVTPAQIDQAMEAQRRRLGLEDQREFEKALAESNLTVSQFRRQLERTLLLDEVLNREVRSRLAISEEELLRYWKEHPEEFHRPEQRRIEELIVREDSGLAPAEREALAATLAEQVASGGALAAIAEAAPEGVLAGPIEHGWVEKGTLTPELDEPAWDLEAGQASAPIAARGGLHVLRVVEIQPAATRPLDEVEDAIRARLGQERYDERVQELVEDLERSAYVVENLPEDAVGYREAGQVAADPLRDLMRGPAAVTPDATGAEGGAGSPAEDSESPIAEPEEPAAPPAASAR